MKVKLEAFISATVLFTMIWSGHVTCDLTSLVQPWSAATMFKIPGDSTVMAEINTQLICVSSPSNALFRRSAIPGHFGRRVGQTEVVIMTLVDLFIDWPTERDLPSAASIMGGLDVAAVSRGWGDQTGKVENGDQGG